MSNKKPLKPGAVLKKFKDGETIGATVSLPQDCYAYKVIGVSASGHTVTLVRLEGVSLATGHKPARYDGPFPVWEHDYSTKEIDEFYERIPEAQRYGIQARWNAKKQRWMSRGAHVVVGRAYYFRNHSY